MSYQKIYFWSAIDRFGSSVISFIGNIILARILSPEDFGLIGMVAIFSAIAYSFADCGLSDGLIRMGSPKKEDYSTVFTFNVIVGVIMLILFFIGAPYIATFFSQPKLIGVVRILGASILFSALTFTQETRLRKLLKTKSLAIVKLITQILALVTSTALALMLPPEKGYWALVFLQALYPVYVFFLFLLLTQWKPKFGFRWKSFKELYSFGFHMFLAYLINQVGRNLNSVVLGKFYTPAITGIYSQAQKLQEAPFLVFDSVINGTSYPILTNETNPQKRVQLSDRIFTDVIFLNALLTSLFLLLSDYIFRILYDSKWDAAIPIFQLLVIYGFFYAAKGYLQTVMKTYGLSKLIKNLAIFERVIQVIALVFTYKYEVYGLIWGQIGTIFLSFIIHLIYYKNIEQKKLSSALNIIIKPIILPITVLIITSISRSIWTIENIYIGFFIFLSAYMILLIGLGELSKQRNYTKYRFIFINYMHYILHKKKIY